VKRCQTFRPQTTTLSIGCVSRHCHEVSINQRTQSLSYPSGRNNELHATESSAVTQRRYSSARDGSPSASTSGSDRSYSPAATTLVGPLSRPQHFI